MTRSEEQEQQSPLASMNTKQVQQGGGLSFMYSLHRVFPTAASTLFDDGEGAGEGRAVPAVRARSGHGQGLLAVEPRLLRYERLHRAPELVRVVHAPARLRVARRHGRPPPPLVLRLEAPQLGGCGAPRQASLQEMCHLMTFMS